MRGGEHLPTPSLRETLGAFVLLIVLGMLIIIGAASVIDAAGQLIAHGVRVLEGRA